MSRHAWVMAVVLAVGLVGPAVARPPEPPPEVRALYDEGTALYKQRRYAEAAERFGQAWAIAPRPGLLHNQGLALEAAGDLPAAAEVVGRLVDSLDGPARKEAEAWLSALKARLARTHGEVVIGAPAHVRLTVDGAEVPAPWRSFRPAGTLKWRAQAEGYGTRAGTVTVPAGQVVTIDATLTVEPRLADASNAARPRRAPAVPDVTIPAPAAESVVGPALVWTGGGLVAVGAILHLAVGLPLALEVDGATGAAFDEGADRAERVLMAGYVAYGLGGALALTGALLWAIDPELDGQVGVTVGPGGIGVHGRF